MRLFDCSISDIYFFNHEMDLAAAHEQNNFLAFRSSCDRCRYMKLKCPSNGNETHEPCERCSKAKLRCAYSRRTNLRRRTAAGQDNGLDAQDGHDSQMAAPDITIDDQRSGQSDESPTPTSIAVRIKPLASLFRTKSKSLSPIYAQPCKLGRRTGRVPADASWGHPDSTIHR